MKGWEAEVYEGDISTLANDPSYNDAYDAVRFGVYGFGVSVSSSACYPQAKPYMPK